MGLPGRRVDGTFTLKIALEPTRPHRLTTLGSRGREFKSRQPTGKVALGVSGDGGPSKSRARWFDPCEEVVRWPAKLTS